MQKNIKIIYNTVNHSISQPVQMNFNFAIEFFVPRNGVLHIPGAKWCTIKLDPILL